MEITATFPKQPYQMTEIGLFLTESQKTHGTFGIIIYHENWQIPKGYVFMDEEDMKYYLDHPEALPEEWRIKESESIRICFWGNAASPDLVRCLRFSHDKLQPTSMFLDDLFDTNHPAAIKKAGPDVGVISV